MFINFVKHMPKDYKSLWIPNMRLFFGGLNGCGVFINFENFPLRREAENIQGPSCHLATENVSYFIVLECSRTSFIFGCICALNFIVQNTVQ